MPTRNKEVGSIREVVFNTMGGSSSGMEGIAKKEYRRWITMFMRAKPIHIERCIFKDGYLGIKGCKKGDSSPMIILNIYSLCALSDKRILWERWKGLRSTIGIGLWCLIQNFNVVHEWEETRGVKGVLISDSIKMMEFNRFIDDVNLLDIPLSSKRFTWFNSSGNVVSRIDKCLVNLEWLTLRPHSTQYVLNRSFHITIH